MQSAIATKVYSFMAFIAIVFTFFLLSTNCNSKGGDKEEDAAPTVFEENEFWELAANLSAVSDLPLPSPYAVLDSEITELKTPEQIFDYVEGVVIATPSHGSMLLPVNVLSGGVAGTLDRVIALDWLLEKKGYTARIMYTPYVPERSFVDYDRRTPRQLDFSLDTAVVDELNNRIEKLSPRLFKNIYKDNPAGPDSFKPYTTGVKEKNVYWVQYQKNGTWQNLIPGDTYIDSTGMTSSMELSAANVDSLSWKVQIRVINVSFDAVETEVLSSQTKASALHNQAITFFNKPVKSLDDFTPVLFIGDNQYPGAPFKISTGGISSQKMVMEVLGPSETKKYTRQLVSPPKWADAAERALEVASVSKISVLNGLLSDEEFGNSVVAELKKAADVLFNDAKPSKNMQSVPALALLDASHRYAGQVGETGRNVFAFLARPSIFFERDFVKADSLNLSLFRTKDMIDGGHAVYTEVTDTAMMAAMEQLLIDEYFEEWLGYEDSLMAEEDELAELIEGDASPVDFEVDAGPEVKLAPESDTADMAYRNKTIQRRRDFCKNFSWLSMLIPMQVMPAEVLLGGLVGYFCKLAEAYDAASNVLENLFSNPDASAEKAKELEDIINGLGEGLARDIVTDAVVGAAVGTAMKPVLKFAGNFLGVLKASAGGFIRGAKDAIAEAVARRAAKVRDVTRKSFSDIKRLRQFMKEKGMNKQQAREFFENYGCLAAGTPVMTPEGARVIEEIAPGDLVYSLDLNSGQLRTQEVLQSIRKMPPACMVITLHSGQTIETTGNHPFFVLPDSVWVPTSQLDSGMVIFSAGSFSGEAIVWKTTEGSCTDYVYDLEVAIDHNYFVTGTSVLVHNFDKKICEENRKIIQKMLSDGEDFTEIVKKMKPQSKGRSNKTFANVKQSPATTGTYKYTPDELGEKWGYKEWQKRAKNADELQKVSEEIGEAGMHVEAKKRGYKDVLPPNKASKFKQGFDGVYKDKDGSWVIGEGKGGYNSSGLNNLLKEGYKHRQGEIGWVEGACRNILDSDITSKEEKRVAGEILKAIHDKKPPVRVEVFHTKHTGGVPRSTRHYVAAKYP